MTAPIPEEQDQPPIDADDPPGEHASELTDGSDTSPDRDSQEENAETSSDQPST